MKRFQVTARIQRFALSAMFDSSFFYTSAYNPYDFLLSLWPHSADIHSPPSCLGLSPLVCALPCIKLPPPLLSLIQSPC